MITTNGYLVEISFADGRVLDISRNKQALDNAVNYVDKLEITENTYTPNQNPIGVITSGVFKLTLTSLDRSLLPNNTSSKYYGYMNSTAMIKLGIEYYNSAGELKTVYFGKYYVSNWTSSSTSSDKYTVVIEGTDLFGILIKNKTPATQIKRNIDVQNYLSDIQNKLNDNLNNKYKLSIVWDSKPKYNTLSTTDIDTEDISTLFNIIDQSLLVNMYINRDINDTNRVINIIDATSSMSRPVTTASDSVDIEYTALDTGALVGYTGVKVNYFNYRINTSGNISTLGGLTLTPGENIIENVDIGGSVFKILSVDIITEADNPVKLESIQYNRRTATLKLNNTGTSDVTVDININGQTMLENKLAVERHNNTESRETLEVTNSIITKNSVNNYATDLLNLINKRGDTLIIRGNFDPELYKLNNVIKCDCSKSLFINSNYRIYSLKWTLGTTLTCEVKLSK